MANTILHIASLLGVYIPVEGSDSVPAFGGCVEDLPCAIILGKRHGHCKIRVSNFSICETFAIIATTLL